MTVDQTIEADSLPTASEAVTTTATPSRNGSSSQDRGAEIVGWGEFAGFIVGTPLNIFVVYLCLRLLQKRACHNQWIVLSMTVADLLFTLIHCPLMFGRYALNQMNPQTCLFMYIMTYLSTIGSSLSLLLLNVDKFILIHKPLHYFVIMTRTRTFIGIGLCWLVALSWTLYFILGASRQRDESCDFQIPNWSLYVLFLVLFFMLPILLSLAISVYIALIVQRTTKANQLRRALQQQGSVSSTNGGTNFSVRTASSNSGGTSSSKARLQTQLRSIVFVFSTTIWSAVSCLPYRVVYIYVKTQKRTEPSWYFASYCLFVLITMNAVLNPLITIVTQKSYVDAVRQMLPCFPQSSKLTKTSTTTRSTSHAMAQVGVLSHTANGINSIKRTPRRKALQRSKSTPPPRTFPVSALPSLQSSMRQDPDSERSLVTASTTMTTINGSVDSVAA